MRKMGNYIGHIPVGTGGDGTINGIFTMAQQRISQGAGEWPYQQLFGVGTPTYFEGEGSMTLPTMEEGDTCYLLIGHDNGSITLPTGWTEIQSWAAEGNGLLCYKVMGATPDTTVTIHVAAGSSNDPCVSMAVGIKRVGTPVSTSAETTGGSGMPDPPSLSTWTEEGMFLIAGVLDDDRVSSVSAPAGFTMIGSAYYGDSEEGATIMMAYAFVDTSTSPDAFGGGGNDFWWAVSVRVYPV